MPLTITYPTRPARPSTHTSLLADLFGLPPDPAPHTICTDLDLPLQPGTITAFTGPSGSGKSSLLRAAIAQLASDPPRTTSPPLPLPPSPPPKSPLSGAMLSRRAAAGEHANVERPPEPHATIPRLPRSPASPAPTILRPDALPLPDAPLIDALPLPFPEATALLSSCGLAEPRLLLRRPAELSDGERFRFRLALALSMRPTWLALDEFTAPLDRTLAKVIAYNLRRQSTRTRTGVLIATCHEDILEDLRPDLHVTCDLDGAITVANGEYARVAGPKPARRGPERATSERRLRFRETPPPPSMRPVVPLHPLPPSPTHPPPSFAPDLHITTGSLADWPRFSRWHYRSKKVGPTRFVTLLNHGPRPVGICVFTTAPLGSAGRNRFFGLTGRRSSLTLRALNRQIASLSRVVLHPTYRGAGLAAPFVRASCELCPYSWIESLTALAPLNPFFEKAGFTRVDTPRRPPSSRTGHSALYAAPESKSPTRKRTKRLLTQETHSKSRHAHPTYFIFDNRKNAPREGEAPAEPPQPPTPPRR